MAVVSTGNFRIDLTKFNLVLHELSRNVGRSKQEVTDSEVTAILNTTITRLPAARVDRIRAYYDERQWLTYQGNRYSLSHRYPDYLWRELQAYLRRRMNERIAGRGLAKQGFLRIGQQLRLPVRAPDFVHVATARGRPVQQLVHGTRQIGGYSKYAVRLYNASPLNQWVRARVTLMAAIGGRMQFFVTNLQKGVFDDATAVARRYPGLTVRPGS